MRLYSCFLSFFLCFLKFFFSALVSSVLSGDSLCFLFSDSVLLLKCLEVFAGGPNTPILSRKLLKIGDADPLTESESELEPEYPSSPGHMSSDAERMTTGSRLTTVSVGIKVEVIFSLKLLPVYI